jgi:hypothetical protein
MGKAPNASEARGGRSRPDTGKDKKQRLAEALRRNLVKRKGKNQTNPESKPGGE